MAAYDLMGAADEITEGEGHTSVALTPTYETLLRVGPQQIADEAGIGNITGADKLLDLLHLDQLGAEATVAAEDLVVDDAGDGEAVEGVSEGLPQLDVVAALHLVKEAVNPVNAGALVVSAQDEEVLGELDLEGEDEADGLETLLSTIHVVTKEQVVGSRGEATVFEEAEEVEVLTVDVTANFDGGLQLQKGGLAHEDLTALESEVLYVVLSQLDLLAGASTADFKELIDYCIYVKGHRVVFPFPSSLFFRVKLRIALKKLKRR